MSQDGYKRAVREQRRRAEDLRAGDALRQGIEGAEEAFESCGMLFTSADNERLEADALRSVARVWNAALALARSEHERDRIAFGVLARKVMEEQA